MHWMASRSTFRRAIITQDLTMPRLVDIATNFTGVWPLKVSYLKQMGREDDGGSLVVRSSYVIRFDSILDSCVLFFWYLELRNGWLFLLRPNSLKEVTLFPHAAWTL